MTILSIIAAELGRDIGPDDLLTDLDPLDRLCIAQALDEEFGTTITDAEQEGWQSVADIVASVGARAALAAWEANRG